MKQETDKTETTKTNGNLLALLCAAGAGTLLVPILHMWYRETWIAYLLIAFAAVLLVVAYALMRKTRYVHTHVVTDTVPARPPTSGVPYPPAQ